MPKTSTWLGAGEGSKRPASWDPSKFPHATVTEIRESQGKAVDVYCWGANFTVLLECLVFSALEGRNNNLKQRDATSIFDFHNSRLEYYTSQRGDEAFEKAFMDFPWPEGELNEGDSFSSRRDSGAHSSRGSENSQDS